jgi:predicted transcriptional regulator
MKRSSPDIFATMLEAANGGIGKTRLLTKANLSSSQFRKFIDLLLEKGCCQSLTGMAGTTGLGLQYLVLYTSIKAVSYLNA